MYILEKYSMPGFSLEAEDLSWIRWMLEHGVCDQCKWTKADYEKHLAENPEYYLEEQEDLREEFADMAARGISPMTFSEFFPENYGSLSDAEKINLLLDTACGCEFGFEESENA